jgi:hypothetical protein
MKTKTTQILRVVAVGFARCIHSGHLTRRKARYVLERKFENIPAPVFALLLDEVNDEAHALGGKWKIRSIDIIERVVTERRIRRVLGGAS